MAGTGGKPLAMGLSPLTSFRFQLAALLLGRPRHSVYSGLFPSANFF